MRIYLIVCVGLESGMAQLSAINLTCRLYWGSFASSVTRWPWQDSALMVSGLRAAGWRLPRSSPRGLSLEQISARPLAFLGVSR